MVKGTHYEIDFIGDEIMMFEKEPLVHETKGVMETSVPPTVVEIVETFKNRTDLILGDLDIVIGDEIWIVDPGTFPNFQNVPHAAGKVGNILLGKIRS